MKRTAQVSKQGVEGLVGHTMRGLYEGDGSDGELSCTGNPTLEISGDRRSNCLVGHPVLITHAFLLAMLLAKKREKADR